MAGAVPTLFWFDRWDDRIGVLPVVGELVHTEELNGEDTIEFECREVPAKGDRLLWRDGSTWRELRFTYGKNMAGCTRTVLEQDVYTALYGFGAGLPFTDSDGNYIAGYRRKLTFGSVNNDVNWVGDEAARLVWGRWNADRTAKVHSFGMVNFSDETDPTRLLARTRKALLQSVQPKVSYEIDVAALDGGDAEIGNTVAVIDTSRSPEWRLTARIVRRVRTFGDGVLARVTIGTVQPADYAQVSDLAADVATLQSDVVGIDGNLTTAASVTVVESVVTEAIDDLDDLSEEEF